MCAIDDAEQWKVPAALGDPAQDPPLTIRVCPDDEPWDPAARVLKLRFTVPLNLTDDEVHEMGERIVESLMTDEPVTFDGTEVADAS